MLLLSGVHVRMMPRNMTDEWSRRVWWWCSFDHPPLIWLVCFSLQVVRSCFSRPIAQWDSELSGYGMRASKYPMMHSANRGLLLLSFLFLANADCKSSSHSHANKIWLKVLKLSCCTDQPKHKHWWQKWIKLIIKKKKKENQMPLVGTYGIMNSKTLFLRSSKLGLKWWLE